MSFVKQEPTAEELQEWKSYPDSLPAIRPTLPFWIAFNPYIHEVLQYTKKQQGYITNQSPNPFNWIENDMFDNTYLGRAKERSKGHGMVGHHSLTQYSSQPNGILSRIHYLQELYDKFPGIVDQLKIEDYNKELTKYKERKKTNLLGLYRNEQPPLKPVLSKSNNLLQFPSTSGGVYRKKSRKTQRKNRKANKKTRRVRR